jgi:hypothetical protein
MIQAVLLTNNEIVVSQCIANYDKDTNEPYFSLMYPYLIQDDSSKLGFKLTPWLSSIFASNEEFMIYSENIIVMKEPRKEIVEQYRKMVLFNEDVVIKETEDVERYEIKEESSVRQVTIEDSVEKSDVDDDEDEIFEEEVN